MNQPAREIAFEEIQEVASGLGANAVVGVDIDYEVLGAGGASIHIVGIAYNYR